MALKITLIDEWKSAWRYGSVQINAVGVFLMGLIEFLAPTWNAMPSELGDRIPYSTTISMVLFALGIVVRILKVEVRAKKDDADNG